ncbi:MAG: hypothetical protein KBC64_01525 [Simkaniaceae bacterium]|nr:hypothetical protein [Simkaniaceae bacterium]
MKSILVILILFTNLVFSQDYQNNFEDLIKNTVWIVPPSTLLAYEYSPSSYTAVTDQTVWVIDSYNDGYFFGRAYTAVINGGTTTYSQKKILGTITSGGAVYMTFIPSGSIATTDLVNGIGTFVKLQGNYQFVMQMNAGSTADGLSHWSYMISINPSSPYYYNLPGVNESLPEFLSNF